MSIPCHAEHSQCWEATAESCRFQLRTCALAVVFVANLHVGVQPLFEHGSCLIVGVSSRNAGGPFYGAALHVCSAPAFAAWSERVESLQHPFPSGALRQRRR